MKPKEFKKLNKKELFMYIFETEHGYSICQECYLTALNGLQNFQIILESETPDLEKVKLGKENLNKIYQSISKIDDKMELGKEAKLLKYRNIIGLH
jgi:hypothetical protein